MIDKVKKLLIIPMVVFIGFSSLSVTMPTKVVAENAVCTIFPFLSGIGMFGVGEAICGTGGVEEVGVGAAQKTANFVKLVLQLVFVGIIIIAVFIIIKSAIKYIRSEGEEDKVKDAQKSIKTVFLGIVALFIGILGIVLVLAFFQVNAPKDQLEDPGTGTFIDEFFKTLFGDGGSAALPANNGGTISPEPN